MLDWQYRRDGEVVVSYLDGSQYIKRLLDKDRSLT